MYSLKLPFAERGQGILGRCRARTREGDQCRNNAIAGTTYCYVSAHGGAEAPLLARAQNFIRSHWFATCSLFLAVLPLGLYYIDKKHQATSGTLAGSANADRRTVLIGNARLFPDAPDGVLFRDGNDPLLSLKIVDGKLLVTTTVRDEKGALIAELHDNQWTHQVRPAIYDRNYNDHVLEILDAKGEVALQVVDFGDAVRVAGIFRCKNGRSWAIGPAGNGLGGLMETTVPGQTHSYHVPQVCQYPSDEKLGQCQTGETQVPEGGLGYRVGSSLELCAVAPPPSSAPTQ